MSNAPDLNISAQFVFDDPRYPLMILDIDGEKTAHSLNLDTLEFRRVCMCNAYESDECVCGAWDNNGEDNDNAY